MAIIDQAVIANLTGDVVDVLATQADASANTLNGLVASVLGYNFNGTTWDRIRGDATDGLLVNLGANNDVTANAGTNLNTSALLTTAAFNAVVGSASLILATQADDLANTTDTLLTSSFLYAFDGSTWDRLKGDSTDGLLVNLGANNDVSAAQSGTWNITNISGTVSLPTGAATETTLASLLTSSQLIDDTIVTLGTTTYTEATTKGQTIAAVRRDADTTLVDTTNELAPLIVDARGFLKVEAFSGETLPVSLTSTTITGTVAVTQSGTWNITNISGTISLPTGAATEATLSSLLTSSQLIDDTIITLGTDTYTEATSKGQILAAVRRDADTTLVNTTNEYGPLQMDANGRLKVEVFSGETLPVSLTSTTITGTVAVTQSGTWDEVGINDSGNSITVDAPVGTPVNVQIGNATISAGVIDETGASAVDALAIGGGTPHDSVDSGNPLKIGGKARTANPTAVAGLDRVDAMFDDLGRQVVITNHVRDLVVAQTTTITSSTSETTILTAGASGVFHDLTGFWVANTSGTATRVDFRDATAGSVIFSVYCPAGDTRGAIFNTPYTQTTAANNWTATCGTSVADVRILVQAVKNV